MDDASLQRFDGAGGVELFGAEQLTIVYSVTFPQAVFGVYQVQSFKGGGISAIGDEAVCFQQSGWSQVVFVGSGNRAGLGADSAENAVHNQVQINSLVRSLDVLGVGDCRFSGYEPGLYVTIFLPELGHVGDQVLHYRQIGHRTDTDGSSGDMGDLGLASQTVFAVDVHSARATDSRPAGIAESQGAVQAILNVEETVQNGHSFRIWNPKGLVMRSAVASRVVT